VTDPKRNSDGSWTITVIKDGKVTQQRVILDEPLAQMGWHAQVDETQHETHNVSIANEATTK